MTTNYKIKDINLNNRLGRPERTRKAEIKQLAELFRAFLQEKGLWQLITIGFNGMAFDTEAGVIESFNVGDLMDGYYNPKTLTVLHEINLNYQKSPENRKMVREFFLQHGYQIETIGSCAFFINPVEVN